MMSQESLARSWEFVTNQESQVVETPESKPETKQTNETATTTTPATATTTVKEPEMPTGPIVIPEVNTLASRISEVAKEIGVPESPVPSQPRCLETLHLALSKEAFVRVVQQITDDCIANRQTISLVFELPIPTLNTTEEQKNLGLDILNAVLPALFLAMNPKTASHCVALIRQVAEHFNFLLRYTPFKDLFFVNNDYLCTGKELGRGKFATVYEGRHTATGQKLAIKMMDKQKLIAEDPRVEEFLQRETSIMKSLEHPSVVRLYDVLETPTSLFLVMEFCPGGTLADYLTNKKVLPEEEAQRYVRQIAAGLQYMRARSVSHRDLKPANLLLVETGNSGGRLCKITDFTFARFLNPGEISKTLVGSPLYMAPEIFNNYQYDGMADLWSVGVIMFEMLVGQVPFPADTLINLINVLRSTEPAIPGHLKLSPNCRHLLHLLLQKEPKKRISWEGFFNHPWITGTMVGAVPMPVFVAAHGGYPVAQTSAPASSPAAVAHHSDSRVRQLEGELKTLKEREETMKQFVKDQQRYMTDQNTRIEQHRVASEALQDRVKKLTAELAEANDLISAYKVAFTDSFVATG